MFIRYSDVWLLHVQLPIGRVVVEIKQFLVHYSVVDLQQVFQEGPKRLVGLEESVERPQLLGQCFVAVAPKDGCIVAEILWFVAVEGYECVVDLIGGGKLNPHLTKFLKHSYDIIGTLERIKPLSEIRSI